VHLRQQEEMMEQVLITGNTYPVKEEIKALGGKWDKEQKGWLVPADKVEEAKKLVTEAPAKPKEKQSFVHNRCRVCGRQADRYTRIYRSGECRNCYEERKMGY
jgi:hypothetical protein